MEAVLSALIRLILEWVVAIASYYLNGDTYV